MWKAFLRSKEIRDNNIYLIVDFVGDNDKFSKEYITNAATQEWLNTVCSQTITQVTDLKTFSNGLTVGQEIKLPEIP